MKYALIKGIIIRFMISIPWYLYELTGYDRWKKEAANLSEAMDTLQYLRRNHSCMQITSFLKQHSDKGN
jgi:hypothetical protein